MRVAWNASPQFGDVSLWPFEPNELVLLTIDGIGRAEPDRFLEENNDANEWNAYFAALRFFFPRIQAGAPPILSASLFDEDPGNNGNEHHHWYLLPPIFRTVENRFARARGMGVAKERGRRNRSCETKERGRGIGRERKRASLCVVLYKPTTTVRLPLLCRELITNPLARPPSYLDPARLTFSTLSSILPPGFQSATYLHARSAKIPS